MFIGLDGVGGGLGLVLEPGGANLGFPVEWLGNSPFSDYLIPGIYLLVINGIGSLLGAVASFRRYKYAGVPCNIPLLIMSPHPGPAGLCGCKRGDV